MHPIRPRSTRSVLDRLTVLAAPAAISLLLSGCGKAKTNRTPVYPAAGKIVFGGQSLEGALVVLHPKGPASPAAWKPTAKVQADGTFRFSTYDTADGAPPGEYVVTISLQRAVRVEGEFLPGPNLLPAKYSLPTTSDISVRIAEGQNDLPLIALGR